MVYGQSVWISKTDFESPESIEIFRRDIELDAAETIKLKQKSVISIAIDGYTDDPRELYEIPEVCNWARKIYEAIPEIAYWLTVDSRMRFAGWLCGPVSRQQINERSFIDRLESALVDMTLKGVMCGEDRLIKLGADDRLIESIRKRDLERNSLEQEIPQRPPELL